MGEGDFQSSDWQKKIVLGHGRIRIGEFLVGNTSVRGSVLAKMTLFLKMLKIIRWSPNCVMVAAILFCWEGDGRMGGDVSLRLRSNPRWHLGAVWGIPLEGARAPFCSPDS